MNLGVTPPDMTMSYKAMERKPGHCWHRDRPGDQQGRIRSVNTDAWGTYTFDRQSQVALALSSLKSPPNKDREEEKHKLHLWQALWIPCLISIYRTIAQSQILTFPDSLEDRGGHMTPSGQWRVSGNLLGRGYEPSKSTRMKHPTSAGGMESREKLGSGSPRLSTSKLVCLGFCYLHLIIAL